MENLKLDVESNARNPDVKLLEELLLDWKIWNKAEVYLAVGKAFKVNYLLSNFYMYSNFSTI